MTDAERIRIEFEILQAKRELDHLHEIIADDAKHGHDSAADYAEDIAACQAHLADLTAQLEA